MAKGSQKIIDLSAFYDPSPKQMEAHVNPAKYRLAGGAMRGGKSFWLCAEGIQLSLDFPYNRGYLCRHENIIFKKTTLRTLFKILPDDLITRHDKQEQLLVLANGSEIYYGGLRPTQSEKPLDRIKSWDLGWWGIDEASETTEDYFLMLTTRLSLDTVPVEAYKGLITSNPEPGWVKTRFIDVPMPNSAFISMLPTDNLHLPPTWIEDTASAFGDIKGWKERYLEGDWNAPMDSASGFYVLSWAMIQGATLRELPDISPVEMGVDVARGGGDKTQVYVRRGSTAKHVLELDSKDTMQTVGRIKSIIDIERPSVVRIDSIGVGAGVADRLHELYEGNVDVQIVAFVSGARAQDNERYFNARSEAYWEVRERFERGDICIPADPELTGQLASVRYKLRSDKRIQIEGKEDMKSRGMRSPDKMDALILSFAGGVEPPLDIFIG